MSASGIPGDADGSGVMFDRLARRYDFMNRVLSLGLDQGWRARAVDALALPESALVLDLATGTGDLALQILESDPTVRVVGLDPSLQMLEVAREKARGRGLASRAEFLAGDAQKLPFGTASFAGSAIAFGIRNVPDRSQALREMLRVTRPGGRVVILELSEPPGGWLGPVARFHVHRVVPWLGARLARSAEYRYLQRSIAAFPPPDDFVGQLERAGLVILKVERLTFGAAHVFVTERPEGK